MVDAKCLLADFKSTRKCRFGITELRLVNPEIFDAPPNNNASGH